MPKELRDQIGDLSAALHRGDVALWLGPEWQPPESEDGLGILGGANWVGIWSESRNGRLGSLLTEQSAKGTRTRLVVEAPGLIDEVLGENFSFAEVCPFFYINGKDGTPQKLGSGRMQRAGGAKIEQLSRIGSSTLIVAGYVDVASLVERLGDLHEQSPELRQILIVSWKHGDVDASDRLDPELLEKLRVVSIDLEPLLSELQRRQDEVGEELSLRVGSERIALAPLLQAQSPIDEEFIVLTQQDISEPRRDEDIKELGHALLGGGKLPWRSLAHGLAWRRPRSSQIDVAIEAMQKGESGDPSVMCIDIPAESGSGLTTLLQQCAFAAANLGFPVLIHHPISGPHIDIH